MCAQRNPTFSNLGSLLCRPAIRLLLGVLLIAATALPALGQTVVGTITRSGLLPYSLAVYEGGNKLFVGDDATGNLVIYHGSTLDLLTELTLLGGAGRGCMAVDEPHGKLYLKTFSAGYPEYNHIAVVNANTHALIKYIEANLKCPLVKDEGLGRIYGRGVGPKATSLAVIDVATDTLSYVPLVVSPSGIDVNPVTHEVFVGDASDDRLDIIDGNTLTLTTVAGGTNNLTSDVLVVNWLENKVYEPTSGWNGYSIYDRDTGTTTIVGCCNDATFLYFNPTGNRVYTDSEVNGVATIIDGATDASMEFPMTSGTDPVGVRWSTNHIYWVGMKFIGVMDDTTQMLELIPVNNPSPSGALWQVVAVNQTTGRVFVVNDANALHSIIVVEDGPRLTRPPVYVAAIGDFSLLTLDPLSKATVSLEQSYAEFGLAVRPGGGRIYEATYDHFSSNGSIRIYAGVGNSMLLAAFEDGGHDPTIPVVTPDGSRLYVTNATSADVSVINTADNSVETVIPVGTSGSKPWGAAVTPDGAKVYVANRGNNTVHVISTGSNTVSTTIPVGTAPWGVAINPAGTKVYVANSGANTVSVIDTASATVIATPGVGTTPHWLAVSPDGGRVYVTNNAAGTVSVIETGGDTVIETVPAGTNPEGVAVMPDGSEVYVVNYNALSASSLSVINPSDYSVTPVSLPTESAEALPIAIADPTSKFAGRVTNPHGAVEGAVVRALQADVEKGTATTNAAGDYSIYNLLSGTYDIEVTASGCSPLSLTGQSVGIGRTNVLNPAFTGLECPMPEVELSTVGMSFGAQRLAATSEDGYVTLTNAGGADLIITGIAKSGGNSGDFAMTHDCPLSPSTLAAAASCGVEVTFTPTAAGPRKSLLTITNDAAGSPHRVLLTGIGSALSVTPAAANFPDRQVGTTSPPSVVTLTNLGTSPLHIWSSAVSGIHAVDFSRANSCPVPPATLAGGASCNLNVNFTPGALGAHTAPLSISHDAGGSPSTVTLSGTGTAPPGAPPSSTASAGGTGDRSRTRPTGSRTPRARQTLGLVRR